MDSAQSVFALDSRQSHSLNLSPVLVDIPAVIAGSGITSLTLPESVTSLGSCAFAYCTDLTSVTLSHGLVNADKDIFVGYNDDKDAFVGCNALVSVVLRTPSACIQCVGNNNNRYN